MAKKLKDVVKTNPEPARGTVGVNPLDPWSAKANIAEDGSLGKYLLSRGINPKFISRDTKISHAKSSAFLKWKQDHQFEEVEHLDEDALLDKFLMSRGINPKYATKEMKISHSKSGAFIKWKNDHMFEEIQLSEADQADVICVDIPLMIRLFELAREDVKDDMELHKITERLIEIRNKGTLTMADYDFIANGKAKIKEEVLDEAKKPRTTALEKWRKAAAEREKKHNQTPTGDMKGAIDKLEKHLNKEEVEQIDELKKSTMASYKDKSSASLKNAQANRDAAEPGKNMSKGFSDLHAKSDKIVKNRVKGLIGYMQRKQGMKPTSENTLDPLGATEAPCDGANGGETTDNTKQKTNSTKIIKSIYKMRKEETYDWEKDDKSVQTYGKSPKLKKTEMEQNVGETKPQARIVMSGGKTLTGEKRDTVEIDPLMKNRPDLNGNIKPKQDK
jgi:hypothetical protein